MAWPPPVLPTTRTNAMPQQDDHPALHNAANLAINDLVGYVNGKLPTTHTAVTQAFPGGSFSTNPGTSGPITIPTAGLWLLSWECDMNPPTANGVIDIYPSDFSGNDAGTCVISSKLYETSTPGRTHMTGLYCLLTAGSFAVYLRVRAYAGTRTHNGGTIRAVQLGPV